MLLFIQVGVNLTEFAGPWAEGKYNEKRAEAVHEGVAYVHEVEQGRLMPVYNMEQQFEDFMEIAMQFG